MGLERDLDDLDLQDNPTDGIFNDRMGALNGVRIQAPVGPLTLRGVYHTDRVSGYRRVFESEDKSPKIDSPVDQKVYLVGCSLDVDDLYNKVFYYLDIKHEIPDFFNLNYSFDYGWPYRIASEGNPIAKDDSVYVDEKLWGTDVEAGMYFRELQSGVSLNFSYGYDWQDSLYTSRFWDYKLTCTYLEHSLTFRYQYNHQDTYHPDYNVDRIFRKAFHIYFTLDLWGLEIQPRYIKFENEAEKLTEGDKKKFKSPGKERYEITTTIRF